LTAGTHEVSMQLYITTALVAYFLQVVAVAVGLTYWIIIITVCFLLLLSDVLTVRSSLWLQGDSFGLHLQYLQTCLLVQYYSATTQCVFVSNFS